jgi:hypothetical protein
MIGKARDLLLIAVCASCGAPISYVLFALVGSILSDRELSVSIFGTMLLTAFLFSFMITEALVVVTLVVARIIRPNSLSIVSVAATYVVCLSGFVWGFYGVGPAAIFFGLAASNALIFVVIGRMRFEKRKFPG